MARPHVRQAKAKLEAAGVQIDEMRDSGVCHGAGLRDPDGNAILITTATGRRSKPDAFAAYRRGDGLVYRHWQYQRGERLLRLPLAP